MAVASQPAPALDGVYGSDEPTMTYSDERLNETIRLSNLANLAGSRIADLVTDATLVSVSAGSALHREGESAPHCEVVLAGLVRVYVRGADGRTMTIRYCRDGSLIGVASLFEPAFAMPASVEAVTPAEILKLDPARVTRMTKQHPDVAAALLMELSERAMSFAAEAAWGMFATVRQRVARHLLDLATTVASGELVAQVSHQELAEAVGSVREVVVRVLGELRSEDILRTGRARVEVLDPERLLDAASPVPNRLRNLSH